MKLERLKENFFFEVLKGWLLLFIMTILFALLSEILKQVLGLSGQGQNEASIQSAFKEQPLLIAVFACVIGPLVEELFFRQTLLRYLRKSLPTWLSIFIVGLAFALTHMHSLDLSEWINCNLLLGWRLSLFYHLCERKRKYLLSLGRPYDSEQPFLYHFSPVLMLYIKKATNHVVAFL